MAGLLAFAAIVETMLALQLLLIVFDPPLVMDLISLQCEFEFGLQDGIKTSLPLLLLLLLFLFLFW